MTTLAKVEQSLSEVIEAKAKLQDARKARDDNRAREDYHREQATIYDAQIPDLKADYDAKVVVFMQDAAALNAG